MDILEVNDLISYIASLDRDEYPEYEDRLYKVEAHHINGDNILTKCDVTILHGYSTDAKIDCPNLITILHLDEGSVIHTMKAAGVIINRSSFPVTIKNLSYYESLYKPNHIISMDKLIECNMLGYLTDIMRPSYLSSTVEKMVEVRLGRNSHLYL